MPIKFFRKYVNARDVRSTRMVAMFGGWLQHPGLWCFNRHTVPAAFAIGLFAGLIPGPVQMLAALLLAVPFKKNLPVALITTLYSNPLTIVPLYLVAYQYGALFVSGEQRAGMPPLYEMRWSDPAGSMMALLDWSLALGKPLAIGIVLLALTLALAGYVAARVGWRIYIVHHWNQRKKRRLAGPPKR
jgi:uncharacterized protein (DUF2062 family)